MVLQGVVVIAGTSSGVGKTSLTVGLMAALKRRGLTVQAFKVGPDFLDPLHHEAATGRPSINLDGWMMDRGQNAATFHRATADADIAVVEGVMGLFDGRDGATEDGSTAQMAKWLGAPVLLVLDCWALARSAAAMVKGYMEFDPDLRIGGLLLNKVGSASHTKWLQDAITSSGVAATFLGAIPKDEGVVVKERYLGLHMPGDEGVPHDYINKLATLVEGAVDMEALMATAASATPPHAPSQAAVQRPLAPADGAPIIAVAQDAAFGFYYRENLALLEAAGARLVYFSPIESSLPGDIAGLYLGGGYPERHARALAHNRGLRAAIAAFAAAGGVVYAECGGLMYLSQTIQPLEGPQSAMVGIFPFRTVMTQGKMKMGYVEVTTQQGCRLFPAGATVRGHVFHFSEMVQERVVSGLSALPDSNGSGGWEHAYLATMQTPGAVPVEEGCSSGNVLASYVHLHFGSNPAFAASLVACCRGVDVAAATSAARGAARSAVRHTRSGSETNFSRDSGGSTNGRRHHRGDYPGGMQHVHSVPNLADLSRRVLQAKRGRTTHSDESSSEEQEPLSPLGPRHGTSSSDSRYSCDYSQGGPGSHTGSLGRISASSSRQDPTPGWGDPRELKGLLPRPGSPATTLQQSCSATGLNGISSSVGSPVGTPPGDDHFTAAHAGRVHNGLWGESLTGPMSRSSSGLLQSPSKLMLDQHSGGMQRSASAMVPSAFAQHNGHGVSGGGSGSHRGGDGYHYGSYNGHGPPRGGAHPRMSCDRMHHSSSVPGRMDDRLRLGRTWPGAAGGGGHRSSTSSQRALPSSRSLPLPNDSIVSLLPSGTEILWALGLGPRVVGVSDQCDWPAEAVELPVVSRSRVDCRSLTPAQVEAAMQAFKQQGLSAFEIDVAALARLQPGLVLTQDACATCDADAGSVQAALQRAGVLGPSARTPAFVLTLAPRTLAAALDNILQVGHVAGVIAEATAVVDKLRARLRAVAVAVAQAPRRPRVLSLEGLTPLVLGGQWLPDLKQLAGGLDEWQLPGDRPVRITWAQVREYAPEVLVLSPCGASVAAGILQACDLVALPGWWSLPAVRAGAVFVADHNLFSRPGPRLVEGVEALARMLHPDLVHTRIADGLVRKITLSQGQRCRQSTLASCFAAYT